MHLFNEVFMISCISSILEKGFWFSSPKIPPAIVSIPLAIESSALIYNTCKNPGFFKTKFIEAKGGVCDFLHQKEGESNRHAIWRRVYQVVAGLGILGAMAGAVKLALVLPATISKTCAVFSIYLIGKVSLNAKNYKDQLVHAFTAQPGESSSETHKKIWINVCKVLALCALAATLITFGCYILPPLIINGFSWSVTLPWQTPAVVFAEYACLGLIHSYEAFTSWRNKDMASAGFHSLAAVLGFVFPSYYLSHEMRLHHSSYGLLMMALPIRPLQFLGSIVTFDSFLYLVDPLYNTTDFINLIVANFSMFFNGFSAAVVENDLNKSLQNSDNSSTRLVENHPSQNSIGRTNRYLPSCSVGRGTAKVS